MRRIGYCGHCGEPQPCEEKKHTLSLQRTRDQALVEHARTRKEYAQMRGERIKWVARYGYYDVVGTLAL
jgi:hypothetical protein